MTDQQFPLIADGQPIIESNVYMRLYDNEDLISNIHGYYQEKDYSDNTRNYEFLSQTDNASRVSAEREQSHQEGKSYAEIAREKARQDVKEKRQAYLGKELKMPTKPVFSKKKAVSTLTSKQKEVAERPKTELSRFTEKLSQDDYILAEIPKQFKEPKNESKQGIKKNNYDFLKRSQIYNRQDNQVNKERSIAQELNLSFEDVN